MKTLLSFLCMIMFVSITYSQRTIGFIEATDDDGDNLIFYSIAQRPATAFGVTPDGELYVSDEEILTAGNWEVDVRVTDDGVPPMSSDATMFITIYPSEPMPNDTNAVVLDSVLLYTYMKDINIDTIYIPVVDSSLQVVIDSVLIPAYWEYNETTYWQYDTTYTVEYDTTKALYTPIWEYQVDTIPPAER